MARKVKDKALDSREARGRLKAQGKPYWRAIEPKLHLGYRRLKGRAGTWSARHYIGDQQYEVELLGVADDYSDADGVAILDFWQAQTEARKRMVTRAHSAAGITGPRTVRECMNSYLEWLESNRKTARDARYKSDALIIPQLGDIECDALTTDQLEKWLYRLAKQAPRLRTKKGEKQQHRDEADDDDRDRRRKSTANRVFTILRAALNRDWKAGKISSDAAWRRVEPFEDVDTARVRYLKVAEAQRLINASSGAFRSLVQAALQTGARYSELARLTVDDFDAEAGTLRIGQSKAGRARHVVLTDEGIALFRQLAAGRKGSALLLPRADGTAWGHSHQIRPTEESCGRAKISPPISFHGLRHTWASLAVMNGIPLLVVAKNLGHTDTRMVEKHYGHLAPSYVADEIRKGAPRFGFKPDPKLAVL
jgi:integrase